MSTVRLPSWLSSSWTGSMPGMPVGGPNITIPEPPPPPPPPTFTTAQPSQLHTVPPVQSSPEEIILEREMMLEIELLISRRQQAELEFQIAKQLLQVARDREASLFNSIRERFRLNPAANIRLVDHTTGRCKVTP